MARYHLLTDRNVLTHRLCGLLLAALLVVSPAALAQERPGGAAPTTQERSQDQAHDRPAAREPEQARTAGGGVLSLLPPDAVTDHTLTTPDGTLPYTATAGTLDLFGQSGDRIAKVFYTSYVAKNASPDRPITFVFNGGPGAGSAFLNLGLVGPKILDLGSNGQDSASAKLIDNPQSWLGFTDLVLIDPIGTGWSRAAKSDDASNFYGVRQDAQTIAKAIALYVTHNNRAASPKYLFGESYGGFRAVKVAGVLQQDQGIVVSGIVMLSPLIEGSLMFSANRFALGAALQLPSLAAAQLERRHALTPEALHDAERFALGEYLTTLAGPAPTGDAARAFYGRVAELTGLSPEIIEQNRGFVRDSYVKHLRVADRAVVSPYDVNIAVPDAYPNSEGRRGDDPVLDGFVRAYGGAFASYARDQLGFKTEMTYTLLAADVNSKWDWGGDRGGSRGQASVVDDMRELLSVNPSFRILVAHGYSDLVTPFAVSRYVIDHLPSALAADRVTLKLYPGGHMIYTRPTSRLAFSADVKSFYAGMAKTGTKTE
jgi:carboxypeptidase C (cathepsin A)